MGTRCLKNIYTYTIYPIDKKTEFHLPLLPSLLFIDFICFFLLFFCPNASNQSRNKKPSLFPDRETLLAGLPSLVDPPPELEPKEYIDKTLKPAEIVLAQLDLTCQEQANSGEKQINYLCRRSFLEICKEQITDLLDPTQTYFQIRDDAKNGFCVENLSEEYVTSFKDGLSNRKRLV